jgi:hypothetical protein
MDDFSAFLNFSQFASLGKMARLENDGAGVVSLEADHE